MKKFIVTIIAIFAALAVAGYAILSVDWNRFNKEQYYTVVTEEVEIEETVISTGEVMTRYWYDFTSYDENGQEQVLELSAAKQLRVGAYLRIYVKDDTVVTSYDEVTFEDIPQKAQQQLK